MSDQTCLLCENPAIVGSSFCTSCLAEPAEVASPILASTVVEETSDAMPFAQPAPVAAQVSTAPAVTFAEPPAADPFAASQTSWLNASAAPIALTEYPKFDHISLSDNAAKPIVPMAPVRPTAELMGVGVSPKSKLVAGVLGIFLGGLGLHNFYLGRTKRGLTQLLVTLVASALTFGFASAAMSIWGLIEGILILTAKPGSQYSLDGYGRTLK